ncbi:MAG: diguanylate cyclase [Candidatus Eremiobacteraeota bacterium]|nr:diguanylate cyclase [Candidatus Eremiobacteraeota bacterium]
MVGFAAEVRGELEPLVPGLVIEVCGRHQAVALVSANLYSFVLFEGKDHSSDLPELVNEVRKHAQPPSPVLAAILAHQDKAFLFELVSRGIARLFYQPIELDELGRQLSWMLGLEKPSLRLFPTTTEPKESSDTLREALVAEATRQLQEMTRAVRESSFERRRPEFRERLRKLVGSLGSFGFVDCSALVRRIENVLRLERPLDAEQNEQLLALSGEVLELLVAPTPDTPIVAQAASLPTILVSSHDATLRTQLASEGSSHRLRVLDVPPGQLEGMLAGTSPDGLIIDFSRFSSREVKAVGALLKAAGCPIIGLAEQPRLQDRAEIASAGVTTLLEKPVEAAHLLEKLQELLTIPAFTRIVAMDDDPVFLASLEAMLMPLRAHFTPVSTDQALWQAVETKNPDLVILDIGMPGTDGIKLCRTLRADPRFAELAIILISANVTAEARRRTYEAGADDCVPKSIGTVELRTRIATRLRRAKASRKLEVDELTQVMTRAPAIKALRHLLSLGRRRMFPVSLAIIDLDHFKQVNDTHGHPVGDQVLRGTAKILKQSFRAEDVVSRWGGEEFVVGMLMMTRAQAARRMRDVLERVGLETFRGEDGSEFKVSFSCGVAQFPEDGMELESLYREADRSLYLAKEGGRAQVVEATPEQEMQTPDRFDVVLVEEDHPLGTVVTDSLEGLGLSVHWIREGRAVLDALAGPIPRVRGRVIVLDNDLADGGGLDLLAQLARDQVVEHSQVITLSGRMNEKDVVAAFDLGVQDHVTKPFILPVLVRRIERALG